MPQHDTNDTIENQKYREECRHRTVESRRYMYDLKGFRLFELNINILYMIDVYMQIYVKFTRLDTVWASESGEHFYPYDVYSWVEWEN